MALFLFHSVNEYKKEMTGADFATSSESLNKNFLDTAIQKENFGPQRQKFQEDFTQNLFGNTLGYEYSSSLDPNSHKTAEGCKAIITPNNIVVDGRPIALVTIKNVVSTFLDAMAVEAFHSIAKENPVKYVIVGNLFKLRLYIDNIDCYVEFDLLKTMRLDFQKFVLALHSSSLPKDIPLKMKKFSDQKKDVDGSCFLAEYVSMRRKLFRSLLTHNPNCESFELFKKSEKLLNRLLFIFFMGGRAPMLNGPIEELIDEWDEKKSQGLATGSFYDAFKRHFDWLSPGKMYESDISGERFLFATDKMLDELIIDGDEFYEIVNVNHRFDLAFVVELSMLDKLYKHSLDKYIFLKEPPLLVEKNDQEEIANIQSECLPAYVVKFMVGYTLGAQCLKKKMQYGIDEILNGQPADALNKLLSFIVQQYRNWLVRVSICDLASGNGSFLSEAANYLFQQHRAIDEMDSEVLKSPPVDSWAAPGIYEHNIYGLENNEEALELTRLCFWLTALNDDAVPFAVNDKHIRYGNSLIDDPEIVGNAAFRWGSAFPMIFGDRKDIFFAFVEDIRKEFRKYRTTEKELVEAFEKVSPVAKELAEETIGQPIDHLHDLIEGLLAFVKSQTGESQFMWLTLLQESPVKKRMLQKLSSENQIPLNEIYYVIARNFLKDLEENFDDYEGHFTNQLKDEKRKGFDTIIGNLPCGPLAELPPAESKFITGQYTSAMESRDLVSAFIEQGLSKTNSKGYCSFILPASLLTEKRFCATRKMLLSKSSIQAIVKLPKLKGLQQRDEESIIIVFQKAKKNNNNIEIFYYQENDRPQEISSFSANAHFFVPQNKWKESADFVFDISPTSDH